MVSKIDVEKGYLPFTDRKEYCFSFSLSCCFSTLFDEFMVIAGVGFLPESVVGSKGRTSLMAERFPSIIFFMVELLNGLDF